MKENTSMKHSVNELADIKGRLETLKGVDIKFKNAIKDLKHRDNLVEQLKEEIASLKNSLKEKVSEINLYLMFYNVCFYLLINILTIPLPSLHFLLI